MEGKQGVVCMTVIPEASRLRQEEVEFEVRLYMYMYIDTASRKQYM